MKKKYQRSTLALAVLALLIEEPMHPYRMQQLMKARGKDEVVNVRQRASIYQTIDRLHRDRLIAVRETTREVGRPDRTLYEVTPEGRSVSLAWMREILSTPAPEFPDFPAAISFLSLLTVEDTLHQLERRSAALEIELARLEREMKAASDAIPRLFLLETEYKRAILLTEMDWVRTVIGDLRAGRLTWNEDWLRQIAARHEPPGDQTT